jgi:hypothetical protein
LRRHEALKAKHCGKHCERSAQRGTVTLVRCIAWTGSASAFGRGFALGASGFGDRHQLAATDVEDDTVQVVVHFVAWEKVLTDLVRGRRRMTNTKNRGFLAPAMVVEMAAKINGPNGLQRK